MAMNETMTDARQKHEVELADSIERELTDDQLLQLAEGSDSWGTNCNTSCR